MTRRVRTAGCLLLLLGGIAGCSTTASPVIARPPIVATDATCLKAAEAQSPEQPQEIVVVEKPGASAAGERYLTTFQNLNGSCVPSGSSGSNTDSFTFAPNVSASLASKIADEMRTTRLFARVTEMSVPPCTTPGLQSGSCTPPTIP
jgi:hypothetical protein